MESVCLRLKTTLFSRWLAAPPAVPDLEVKTTSTTISAKFVYSIPTPFNQYDVFEFQASLKSEEEITPPHFPSPSLWLSFLPTPRRSIHGFLQMEDDTQPSATYSS